MLTLSLAACQAAPEGDPQGDYDKAGGVDENGKADSSAVSTILDFEFDGELTTSSSFGLDGTVRDQMLYTIGQLNGNRAVGRLDRLTLTNIQRAGSKVTYHAKMPVSWGSKTNLPTSYTFQLPRNADDYSGFTTKFKATCTDPDAHDVDVSSMWYYYRPSKSGCAATSADVTNSVAKVTVSTVNTNGKYPEYHKVWEDNSLKVLSIFGKYENGATSTSDAGISAFNSFVKKVRTAFPTATTTPATVAVAPGPGVTDVQFDVTLSGGKKIQINALLVDEIASASTAFYTRYNALSTRADLIAYNGHAGLGQNVRALAKKGSWVAGQYVILFMNGCDTYAYVDGSLADTRRTINSDDPTGTKYLDFVVNGMPSFFASDADATMALINGLLKTTAPLTYQSIFGSIDSSQIVMVTGEEDNVYYPGFGGGTTPPAGKILDEHTNVDTGEMLQFATADLAPGDYKVTLTADAANTAGDADLYVRTAGAPTEALYDCRPYIGGSNEECAVKLTARGKIYVAVNGYEAASFGLTVTAVGGGTTTGPAAFAGLDVNGTVLKSAEQRWETSVVPAGTYSFDITGTGDADLYVRTGAAPTTTAYDCRPYKSGSTEHCEIALSAPASFSIMVRGYAATSTFRLVAAVK